MTTIVFLVRDVKSGAIYGIFRHMEMAKHKKAHLMKDGINTTIDHVETDLVS